MTASPRTIACKSQVLFDAISGAGAETWPWYFGFAIDEDKRTLDIEIDNGKGGTVRKTLTVTDLRRAIDEIVARWPESIGGYLRRECAGGDPDLDVIDADAIIQVALLGDVVFS